MAFEQGKTLPTPETVPFRLTRDIVDGMGIAGVEGVFRRCCEKTMSLMRAHQEELRTIVEVSLCWVNEKIEILICCRFYSMTPCISGP